MAAALELSMATDKIVVAETKGFEGQIKSYSAVGGVVDLPPPTLATLSGRPYSVLLVQPRAPLVASAGPRKAALPAVQGGLTHAAVVGAAMCSAC